MPDFVLLLAVSCALALGVGAAQIGGPVSWSWGPQICTLRHRLYCLTRRAPSARLKMVGSVLLAAVLAGGGLAAYAAQPSAPARLVRQVAMLIAEPDKPSRSATDGAAGDLAKPGDARPEDAGLDPTIWTDKALLARAQGRGVWDGVTLYNGMTFEQTRRYFILNEKFEVRLSDYVTPYREAALLAGQPRPTVMVAPNDIMAALGPKDGREYRDLIDQKDQVIRDEQQAVFDRYGPVQVRVTQVEALAFSNEAVGLERPTSAAGPMGQFGRNAVWKLVQRYPDGSMDEVLSPARPVDNSRWGASMTDNPGPFAPKIQPVTVPFTRFTILGNGFGLSPMRPGETAEATVTVDGQTYALPLSVTSATTVVSGGVTYPVTHTPPAATS